MKNTNTKFIFGEARLVFQNAGPETPQQQPRLTEAFVAPMRQQGLTLAENALGEKVDLNKVFGEPENRQALVENISERFAELGHSIDKLGACLGMIFGEKVSRDEIDSAMPSTAASKEDEESQHPEDKEKVTITTKREANPREVTKRNLNRAKGIADKLKKNQESALNPKESWLSCIGRASGKWGFSKETLITFIEMESSWNPNDTPVYKDKDGKKVHAGSKRLLSKNQEKEQGLKLYSSAHGLAQAMRKSVPKYVKERYDTFVAERNANNPRGSPIPDKNDPELLYNPEVAIDFMGWHLDEIVNGVNHLIRNRTEFNPEHNLDKNSDMKWLYMAYNNGALGYLVLRRYEESKAKYESLKADPSKANEVAVAKQEATENGKKLIWFQQRDYKTSERISPDKFDVDKEIEGDKRANYAERVAQVEAAVESLNMTI